MKNKFYLLFLLLLCQIFITQPMIAQAQRTQATVNLRARGLSVSFRTEMRDAADSVVNGSFDTYVYLQDQNVIHRVLIDENSGLFFGYDFEIKPDSAEGLFKVLVRPLSVEPRKMVNIDKYTSTPLPKYPDSVVMKEGETLVLSLLENPQLKIKLVDLIKISKNSPTDNQTTVSKGVGRNQLPSTNATEPTAETRDFTPDAVELRLNDARLYINDKRIFTSAKENYAASNGECLYLYIPGEGRFIFSLTPRRNYEFQKLGVIENNQISFTLNNKNYRLISTMPILELRGKWNLWVFHDAEYQPKTKLPPSENYKAGITSLNQEN